MKRADGVRCLFIFTGKQSISQFVELMERPQHSDFTAVPFDRESLIDFLSDTRLMNNMVAIDPVADCEFSPIEVGQFINSIRRASNP